MQGRLKNNYLIFLKFCCPNFTFEEKLKLNLDNYSEILTRNKFGIPKQMSLYGYAIQIFIK